MLGQRALNATGKEKGKDRRTNKPHLLTVEPYSLLSTRLRSVCAGPCSCAEITYVELIGKRSGNPATFDNILLNCKFYFRTVSYCSSKFVRHGSVSSPCFWPLACTDVFPLPDACSPWRLPLPERKRLRLHSLPSSQSCSPCQLVQKRTPPRQDTTFGLTATV